MLFAQNGEEKTNSQAKTLEDLEGGMPPRHLDEAIKIATDCDTNNNNFIDGEELQCIKDGFMKQ